MKKIIITILFLGVILSVFGQDSKGQSNNISLFSSVGAYEDGFNIGFRYEHQNRTIYVGPELFIFPNLNDLTYIHLIGRFGLNKEWGRVNKFRIFAGGRAGAIKRESLSIIQGLLGLEAGTQFTFKNGVFGKLSYSIDNRTDSVLWNKPYQTVNNVYVELGVRF